VLIVAGSQSATIEWINFSQTAPPRQRKPSTSASLSVTVPVDAATPPSAERGHRSPPLPIPSQRTGRYRPHHFFDNPSSSVSSGTSTPKCSVSVPGSATSASGFGSHMKHSISGSDIERIRINTSSPDPRVDELEVNAEDRMSFAHYGYVYALHMITRQQGSRWLVSGSGDSDVKIWLCLPGGGLRLLREFNGLSGGVLSFAVRDSLLFAGLQDGQIVVWDLETGACIRTIEAHESDVMTMSVLGSEVYTAGADGRVIRVNEEFDCTAAFRAHSGIILDSTIVEGTKRGWELVTAGNDSYVKVGGVTTCGEV
jgi:di- and tripeptidase